MESKSKQLLRILCIHGYRQNSKMFREKTGSLRKVLKKYADFTFITAHHPVPPGNMGSAAWQNQAPEESSGSSKLEESEKNNPSHSDSQGQEVKGGEGERGWWFSREDDYFKSTDYSNCDKGFSESIDQVISVLEEEEGKFDGILGFSQGASLVSILCSMQHQQKKQWFKFAVIFSGFKSPSSRHDEHYDNISIQIPSLHVIGEGDEIISSDRSEKLATYFENVKCVRHPGGHFVPASSAQKKAYIDFFEEMKQLCLS